VFIYAPKKFKIQRVMEVYGDSREAAEKNIRRSDEARAAYYKNISGCNWGSRENYELLLDSSVGLESCADVLCAYIGSSGKN
ncbi:MAG: cytidylate kinase-like family protein, partial [Butyrivibrio sp.]|nr:cytidylate kinase-like family protein [Butyrivibrio sp.]